MREILFKGKTKGTSKNPSGLWLKGFPYLEGNDWYILYDFPGGSGPGRFKKNEVIKETICQFTGLTDKNNVNIFEGDYDEDGNMVVWCDRCHGWQFAQIDVPTKDICIPCHWCDGNFDFSEHIKDFVISGNIHDIKL